jgi:two-component system NarL family response regulator
MTGTAADISLMIVDDHQVVRHGLSSMLATIPGMRVVAEADNGQSALAAYALHHPAVVLMDWQMPVMNGFDCLKALLARWPEARVIMLSVYDGAGDVHGAITAGAAGYLLKSFEADELTIAIRTVHGGDRHLEGAACASFAAQEGAVQLTTREREILALVVAGRANKEIAAILHLADITVRMHLTRIFAKLQVADRTQAVMKAIRMGLHHL